MLVDWSKEKTKAGAEGSTSSLHAEQQLERTSPAYPRVGCDSNRHRSVDLHHSSARRIRTRQFNPLWRISLRDPPHHLHPSINRRSRPLHVLSRDEKNMASKQQ